MRCAVRPATDRHPSPPLPPPPPPPPSPPSLLPSPPPPPPPPLPPPPLLPSPPPAAHLDRVQPLGGSGAGSGRSVVDHQAGRGRDLDPQGPPLRHPRRRYGRGPRHPRHSRQGKRPWTASKHLANKGVDQPQITQASLDLSPAFISGVKESFPAAAITFDRFHVVKSSTKR